MRKIGNKTTTKLLNILQMQVTFLACLAVMLLIVNFVAYPIQIDGKSMDPTLHDKDFGFSSILSLKTQKLERFDVVIVKVDDEYWVKRVMALPGETISCKDNHIYINGELIEEDFLDQEYVQQEIEEHGFFTKDFNEVKLNDNEVFLMGDNRVHSLDSRIVGPFDTSQLIAKDIYILWPFNHGKVVK
ncbi:signal peptidase I [Traorella massiliensis]|uniref:signal peptidase I n=1 Tax=Traorella massiliensis TaxID=1903263 RepID=UPI0008F881F9|nr:signal peptidase I [Traorella massiliensis]